MTTSIDFLQQLVDHYLPGKNIKVSYRGPNFKLDGEANFQKKMIEIRLPPRKDFDCNVGDGSHHPLLRKGDTPAEATELKAKLMTRAVKILGVESFTDDDFVLFTALHEIGHFLFRKDERHPRYVRNALSWAKKDYSSHREPSDPENPSRSALLDRIDYQYGSEFRLKVQDYIVGLPNHVKVNKWAWTEFVQLKRQASVNLLRLAR